MTFNQCRMPALKVKVHESSIRVTLTLETELDAVTARVVGCHDSAFDAQDNPRNGFESMELPYRIDACQIKLLSARENGMSLLITPQSVDHFKVLRLGDSALGLRFSVTTDRAKDAIDFMLETAGVEFGASVEPGQAELDFTGESERAAKPTTDEEFMKGLGISDEPGEGDDATSDPE